jgi:hypothetical protein
LRELLGVSVDVSDEVDEKEKESGSKKKKATHLKSKVKVGFCRSVFWNGTFLISFFILDNWP